MFVGNGLRTEGGPQKSLEQVRFHGSAVEPVVELGDIAFEMFAFDRVVSSEQEALQVGQRDMHPGKKLMSWLLLAGDCDGGVLEAFSTSSMRSI